jgi:hypothetical protein
VVHAGEPHELYAPCGTSGGLRKGRTRRHPSGDQTILFACLRPEDLHYHKKYVILYPPTYHSFAIGGYCL